MPPRFKAIVLSCDEYHPFVDHMIAAYDRVWPDHPFEFWIPYQNDSETLSRKHGDRVIMIQTGHHFRDTVLGLLETLDDDEWIYWCLDDKYPIEIDQSAVRSIIDLIQNPPSPSLGGILFCRPARLYWKNATTRSGKNSYLEDSWLQRTDYSMIWIHQFVKVKVIRKLFESFPETPFQAKAMDAMKYQVSIPEACDLFVSEKSLAYFGESTTGGMITSNCADSFTSAGFSIPNGFAKSPISIYIGRDSFFGKRLKVRMRAIDQQLHHAFSKQPVSGPSKPE
jgi:hypothetical protein